MTTSDTGEAPGLPAAPAVMVGEAEAAALGKEREASPGRGPRVAARRRWLRLVVRAGVAAAGLWLGAAAASLGIAWYRADQAAGHLADAVDGASPGSLLSGQGLGDLRAARAAFAAAHARTGSGVLAPLRALPIVGRQLDSAGALSAAAVDVLDTGIAAIERSRAEIDAARTGGRARVDALHAVAGVAEEAARHVDDVDLGPGSLLAPPLAAARAEFGEHLADLDDGLDRLGTAARGLATMLDGPRHYLLLAGNNNEMRIGSGTFLTAGVLTMRGGELELSRTVSTADLHIPPALAPPLPADQERLWGWLAPTSEWRNLGASPRFDVTGRLAAEMAEHALGGPVDGVLAVDPFALRAIVDAVGGVDYRGGRLTADGVVPELLWAQYEGIERYDDPQIERREDLGDLARAALDALDTGEFDTETLLDELGSAAAGRHVLAWSRHPEEQRAFVAAGIAGRLARESVMVGVHNRGGNKLDTFLVVDADLEIDPGSADGADHSVRITLELGNVAPPDLPRYVEGPYPGAVGARAGLYQGLVVVQIPGVAGRITATGGAEVVGHAPDGAHEVVVVEVAIPRGGTDVVEIGFSLPERFDRLRIEPSARAQPVTWTYDGGRFTDASPREITW